MFFYLPHPPQKNFQQAVSKIKVMVIKTTEEYFNKLNNLLFNGKISWIVKFLHGNIDAI